MAINVEAVLMVLLGVLALSAPAGLSLVLFRVLVKEGCPLDRQKFLGSLRGAFLFVWPLMFLSGLFGVLGDWRAAPIPDRLRTGSTMCAMTLLLVLSWIFVMLALGRQRWAKLCQAKAFSANFFYLFELVY